jgi:quinoprotein glucose dehydrogenase
LDRLTGKPLFDMEERAVPASKVPGEQAFPRQPFPLKPPPFARQGMRRDELTNVTPESRAHCAGLLEGATLDWGGASFDPETNTLYVNSLDVGMFFRMEQRPGDALSPYRPRSLGMDHPWFWDNNRLPCQQPPWGHLTAIDLNTGEFRWRSVLGVVDALLEKGLPPTGAPNIGGSIVTAGGLVFIGATNDRRFRAFDKETGAEAWVTRLPASGHATPMTYLGPKSRKQFVVIAAGGGNRYGDRHWDALIAYTLP